MSKVLKNNECLQKVVSVKYFWIFFNFFKKGLLLEITESFGNSPKKIWYESKSNKFTNKIPYIKFKFVKNRSAGIF